MNKTAAVVLVALVAVAPAALAVDKQCKRGVKCTGTDGEDTLRGTRERDEMYGLKDDDGLFGRGAADDMYGGKGSDDLDGDRGADRLYGDDHSDALVGGPGDDRLDGGRDADFFIFEGRWGHDRLFDRNSYGNSVQLWDVSENLVVRLHPSRRHEISVGDGASTVNWSKSPISVVYAGSGNDRVHGDADRNRIWIRSGGRDSVYAGGDDDVIFAMDDGDGADRIDCGRGDDAVSIEANDDRTVLVHCERVHH